MGLVLSGQRRIAAEPRDAWRLLNDVEVLRASIPGCEDLQKTSDQDFVGTIALKIGPVKARFQGTVSIEDPKPPLSCRLSGKGNGGVAGLVSGFADIALAPVGEETLVTYTVNLQVNGRIAQFGSRLLAGTIEKLSHQFFEALGERIALEVAV
jgi:uncharacterized protein